MEKSLPPKVFVSYAHVSEDHKTWVRGLAARLRADGVDVQLDQWHNTLGTNLPLFMESGLREADRVLAIISDDYRERINSRQGGAGFEGQLLSSDLLTNQTGTRVIPILRDNTAEDFNTAVPSFLRGYLGIDMRDSDLFEGRYEELLRDIHGRPVHEAPPIGDNPFDGAADYMPLPVAQLPSAYSNPDPEGTVVFQHEDNNGRYVIGSGSSQFTTKWTVAGEGSVYAYHDAPDIDAIALAKDVADPRLITSAGKLPRNSRSRHARVGDTVFWLNVSGYWAATTIRKVTGDSTPTLTFEYWTLQRRTDDFTTLSSAPR